MPVEISDLTRKEKGTYVLVIHLEQNQRISVGRFPPMDFKPGFYIYVGKAKNRLRARLSRHLSREKKFFWHIDYFLQRASINEVWIRPNFYKECLIARQIKKSLKYSYYPIIGFGSSDCLCPSHFLFIRPENENLKALREKLNFTKVSFHGV